MALKIAFQPIKYIKRNFHVVDKPYFMYWTGIILKKVQLRNSNS